MDFGTLLTVAQKNGASKQSVSYYPSKFTPPKKESKSSKSLSSNIKKFLAKKEEEEKQKALDAKKRKENLLALRDHKAQSRINKHLKVCKSANKSVLADAIDNDNTALTMAGPSQPDEDDYGYVSQEASAFYNQLMNKYNNLPAEKPLFTESGKKTVKDIASTKDRVRQALKQQEIEDSSGHRRKRKSQGASGDKESNTETEIKPERERPSISEKESKDERPKPKRRPLPPPMDFMQLLQIAEKKQHEPVVIDVKPKPVKIEEPERLMTKKQMREHLKEKEWRERKEQRDRANDGSSKVSNSPVESAKISKPTTNRIPKLNGAKNIPSSTVPEKNSASRLAAPIPKRPVVNEKSSISKPSEKDQLLEERKKIEAEKKMLEEMRRSIEEEKKKLALSKGAKVRSEEKSLSNGSSGKSKTQESKVPAKDSKLRQALRPDLKPRQFPPSDLKPKQFPPPDVRPVRPKQFPPKDVKRKPLVKKRRIYDDDSEHDSELDDFIDDGPEEGAEDYSKYISEIFGYDKSKYRDIDEDDAGMESNFAQQLKEEYVSAKMGLMEDLEDIRMEALEKKRKALGKSKKSK